MRGVPSAMKSCKGSSSPPSELFDSTGPYCGLVNSGLVWQTRQCGSKSRIPSVGWSSSARLPALWADAPSGKLKDKGATNSSTAAPRFTGLLIDVLRGRLRLCEFLLASECAFSAEPARAGDGVVLPATAAWEIQRR